MCEEGGVRRRVSGAGSQVDRAVRRVGGQCLLICRGDCLLLDLAKETFTSYGRWARPGW